MDCKKWFPTMPRAVRVGCRFGFVVVTPPHTVVKRGRPQSLLGRGRVEAIIWVRGGTRYPGQTKPHNRVATIVLKHTVPRYGVRQCADRAAGTNTRASACSSRAMFLR